MTVEANLLADPADVKAAVAGVELCREIANSAPLRPFVKRGVAPGDLQSDDLESFVRMAAETYWHQSCTAKMGLDDMSVVDGNLKVHGIDRLRIADASIMPRITTGNTMAPCMVIGERAAAIISARYEPLAVLSRDIGYPMTSSNESCWDRSEMVGAMIPPVVVEVQEVD